MLFAMDEYEMHLGVGSYALVTLPPRNCMCLYHAGFAATTSVFTRSICKQTDKQIQIIVAQISMDRRIKEKILAIVLTQIAYD